MKLSTSKGIEYNVGWAGVSATRSRQMLIKMQEERPFVTIIAELEGIDWAITIGPDGQPSRKITGKMRIVSAAKIGGGGILFTLENESDGPLTVEEIFNEKGVEAE